MLGLLRAKNIKSFENREKFQLEKKAMLGLLRAEKKEFSKIEREFSLKQRDERKNGRYFNTEMEVNQYLCVAAITCVAYGRLIKY